MVASSADIRPWLRPHDNNDPMYNSKAELRDEEDEKLETVD